MEQGYVSVSSSFSHTRNLTPIRKEQNSDLARSKSLLYKNHPPRSQNPKPLTIKGKEEEKE